MNRGSGRVIWGGWLLPPARFARDEEGSHFRAVVLMAFALSSAFVMLLCAVLEFAFDVPMLGVVLAIMGVALLALALWFRQGLAARACGNLLAAVIFGGLSVITWLSGGRAVGVMFTVPIFVLFCTLTLGKRDALVWCAVALASTALAAGLVMRGAAAPYAPKPEWVSLAPYRIPALMTLMAAAIGFMVVAAYRRMRRVLQRSRLKLRSALRQSRHQEQRFEDFAQLAGDYFWETDAELRLTHVSQGYGELLGVETVTLLGLTPGQVGQKLFANVPGNDPLTVPMQQREAFRDQRLFWRRDDGSYVALNNHGLPVFDETGEFIGYRGVIVDVSEAYRLNRELRARAETDALTGLSNRRAFSARYEARRAEAHPKRDWLMYLDLDNFKQINDRGGHDAGDRLLQAIAQALRDCIRASDLAVRTGGDEFLLFVLDADPPQVEAIALRAEGRVEALRGVDPAFAPIGVSVGSVQVPQPAPSLDEMLKLADAACYARKRERKSTA